MSSNTPSTMQTDQWPQIETFVKNTFIEQRLEQPSIRRVVSDPTPRDCASSISTGKLSTISSLSDFSDEEEHVEDSGVIQEAMDDDMPNSFASHMQPCHPTIQTMTVYYCMPVAQIAIEPVQPNQSLCSPPMPGCNSTICQLAPAPGPTNAAVHPADDTTKEEEVVKTTVMLRNIPPNFTCSDVINLLDAKGLHLLYDFVYVPCDFRKQSGLGYAFVNLVSPAAAQKAWIQLDSFSKWSDVSPGKCSTKVCEVCWGNTKRQGLNAQIDYYRNSPVMHASTPEAYRPALFQNGEHIPFPAPTQYVRPPRSPKASRAKKAVGV